MPHPLTHLYALALHALKDQARVSDELRARIAPVLGAALVGVALVGGPLVGSNHPRGLAAVAAAISLGALAVAVGCAARLLCTPPLRLDFDPVDAMASAAHRSMFDRPAHFEAMMIMVLGGLRIKNDAQLDTQFAMFTMMVCGILVAVCGLGCASVVA